MSGVDTLHVVAAYRRAARRAATAGAPLQRRLSALVELAAEARKERDATVRSWVERVIYAEGRPLFVDPAPDGPGDVWERAQRRARAKGWTSCPTCSAVLATDRDLERPQRRRQQRIRELEVREAAPDATERAAEEMGA